MPVWGERYERVFVRYTLPALLMAAKQLGGDITLLLYADKPELAAEWAQFFPVKHYAVPGPDRAFMSLSQAHRHALSAPESYNRVVLLTSDMVVSANALAFCNRQMDLGKRCICVAAMRVTETDERPPWEDSRRLLEWGWRFRHPMTEQSTWPHGVSYDIARMYFANAEHVVTRVCLPHPLAVTPMGPRRPLQFRPTIDVNLVNNFSLGDIYMVTSPEEAGVIELSPMDKEFLTTETMETRFQTQGPSLPSFTKLRSMHQRHFFSHRIVISGGEGDVGDGVVMERLLAHR